MVTHLPRSAWGARAAEGGPGLLTPSRVKGVAIHWPGTESKTPIVSQASVASVLRGWQAFHMDDRGWSDIAYQVAVDQAGRVWDLRGLRTQSGANGDVDVNEQYGAILLVLVQGEKPSDAMKRSVRAVVAEFRGYFPGALAVVPHSAVRPEPTDCPGPAATAALKAGAFNPEHVPTQPPEEDMWDPATAETIEKRNTLADQLWRAQTASEQAVSNALAAQLLAKGMPVADVVAEVEKIWKPVQQGIRQSLERL